jgi:hypothetical protein
MPAGVVERRMPMGTVALLWETVGRRDIQGGTSGGGGRCAYFERSGWSVVMSGRTADVVGTLGEMGVDCEVDSGEVSLMSDIRRETILVRVCAGGVYTVAGS